MTQPVAIYPFPTVSDAPLPVAYEKAKNALSECVQIDECKDWADKAAALASYAKQAKNEQMVKDCLRIQARAIERCGELLKQIEPAKPGPKPELRDGAVPQLGREQAARDAGLSERQRKTALRIASIPKEKRDALIESDSPPTITELAELGTQKKPQPERLARMCRMLAPYHAAARVLAGRDPAAARRANADALSAILDDLSPEAAQRARRTILHLRELARTGEAA